MAWGTIDCVNCEKGVVESEIRKSGNLEIREFGCITCEEPGFIGGVEVEAEGKEEAAASMGSGLRGAYFLKKPLNDSEAD